MKFNNKGFMLVEVIVTSVMVLTILVSLYASFNKLYNTYKIKNSYSDIDSLYATKMMIDKSIETNNFNLLSREIDKENTYIYLVKNRECISDIAYCHELVELYNINNMIVTSYDEYLINNIKNKNTYNETYQEYIDYISNYYEFKDNYSYIALTEVNNNDKYYYANLRIR